MSVLIGRDISKTMKDYHHWIKPNLHPHERGYTAPNKSRHKKGKR